MNRVIISGNLTRDPELVITSGGLAICKFGMAVNERRKQGEEWVDVAHFVDCTYFGRRGEIMTEKAQKGDRVQVDGRLNFSSWETDDGKRSKLEVVAHEVEGEFVFRKAGESRQSQVSAAPANTPVTDDDDIPF